MSATEGLSGNSDRNHTKGMAKGEENKISIIQRSFYSSSSEETHPTFSSSIMTIAPPKKTPSRSVFCPKSVSSVQMTKTSSLEKKAI
jgi:hypothetical protein